MIVLLTIIVCLWAYFARKKHPPLAEIITVRARKGERGWRFFTGKRAEPVEIMIADFPRACREYMKTHDYRQVTRSEPITP